MLRAAEIFSNEKAKAELKLPANIGKWKAKKAFIRACIRYFPIYMYSFVRTLHNKK
jgi:hypothetical protein